MSAEAEERTELEELEEKLKNLESLSVREESDAARSCQHLITVVMCTFAPPKLAVVMNALLTFPEKHKVTSKELSKQMQLDARQMRDYLANLKSMGYVLETTGITEWAQKQNKYRGRYRQQNGNNSGKAAQYHVDYQYFIMMTKFRLHSILKRLNAQQKKEDDMGEGYVCCNDACYSCYKIKKIMDLIYEQQSTNRGNISDESHFVCSECGKALIDAQQYYDNQNAALTKTMRFNNQMRSMRQLLSATEKKVIVERANMGTEISKIEDKMDRIRNGSGHSAYKAATLSIINGNDAKKNGYRGTGLAHLDRIGRRANYSKKDFECQINENNEEKNKDNDDDDVEMKGNDDAKNREKKMKEEKQFQKDVKQYIHMIRDYELGRTRKKNANGHQVDAMQVEGINGKQESEDDSGCGLNVSIKVNKKDVKLIDVLNGNRSKYEEEMSAQEWNKYQEILDQLGLLEVD
eukprot:34515_1